MYSFLFDETKGRSESEDVNSAQFLREQVAQVRQQIQLAEDAFNLLDDDALMDALIYRIKALNLYYGHLLRLARLEEHTAEAAEACEERISEVMG